MRSVASAQLGGAADVCVLSMSSALSQIEVDAMAVSFSIRVVLTWIDLVMVALLNLDV